MGSVSVVMGILVVDHEEQVHEFIGECFLLLKSNLYSINIIPLMEYSFPISKPLAVLHE
jgi:hypothetical protein